MVELYPRIFTHFNFYNLSFLSPNDNFDPTTYDDAADIFMRKIASNLLKVRAHIKVRYSVLFPIVCLYFTHNFSIFLLLTTLSSLRTTYIYSILFKTAILWTGGTEAIFLIGLQLIDMHS